MIQPNLSLSPNIAEKMVRIPGENPRPRLLKSNGVVVVFREFTLIHAFRSFNVANPFDFASAFGSAAGVDAVGLGVCAICVGCVGTDEKACRSNAAMIHLNSLLRGALPIAASDHC
jgi:hypothetical protein